MIRLGALRLFRLGALVLIAWLLYASTRPTLLPLTIEEARLVFPQAERLVASRQWDGSFLVFNAQGEALGLVLTTSPQASKIMGYSGPNNILIALDNQGKVLGAHLLTSGDTVSHVESIRETKGFWGGFTGWKPRQEAKPAIDAVAGSTLTSMAIAEAVEKRLKGKSESLRFPNPLLLEETLDFFPGASSIAEEKNSGWYRVLGEKKDLLGFVLRTAPFGDAVRGYRGPTEALAAIAIDEKTILRVKLRSSYDTAEFVDRVKEDGEFLQSLAGKTIAEWARLDFKKAGIEGVSGATQTSFGLAEGLKKRFQAEMEKGEQKGGGNHILRTTALFLFLGGALFLTFSPLRKSKKWRRVWQILLIAGFGLSLGDLLSLALFAGWARHGAIAGGGLAALAASAILLPLFTRRNIYCQNLCPHGAAQEWVGQFRWRLPIAPPVQKKLSWFPFLLLALALALAFFLPTFDLANLEPFDVWILRAGIPLAIALAGLAAALVLPMAYCRFGCPTGWLLNFMRSGGAQDHFGPKDFAAVGLLTLALSGWLFQSYPALQKKGVEKSPEVIQGKGFGTTWSVKGRPGNSAVWQWQPQLEKEIERIENALSHWRPGSATAQFNASETVLATEQTPELIALLEMAKDLSKATQGAYDITVGPLTQAWGYGPMGVQNPPGQNHIATILERVGWQKLLIDPNANTLRKTHPLLQLDLGSLLQGYAADRLALLIETQDKEQDYLIEVGGELRAKGAWSVAIENPLDPSVPLRTLVLKNGSLATSAVHRSQRTVGGIQVHHFIDPRTGKPAATDLQLCSVQSEKCVDADGWATALMVIGLEKALRLCEEKKLQAWLLDNTGQLHIAGMK